MKTTDPLEIADRIKLKFHFDNYKGGFLFFNTAKQSTWLIFSDKDVFCVLQTFAGNLVTVKFRMRTKDLVDNINQVKFENIQKDWLPDYSDGKFENYGFIIFPNVSEKFYYSKTLFPFTQEIIDNIINYTK